jgi:uncharacterized membrane protein
VSKAAAFEPDLDTASMQSPRYVLLFAGLLLSSAAQADVIKCRFTEPFMTTSYDTASKRMTVTHDVEKRETFLDGVSMRETARGVFEFRAAGGQIVQHLKRTCRGADGMSLRKYPYTAKLNKGELTTQTLYGGCASTGVTKC